MILRRGFIKEILLRAAAKCQTEGGSLRLTDTIEQ